MNKKESKRPKVLFFDVNETLLDLSSVKSKVKSILNGNEDQVNLWFTTMLQYSLVTSAADQYESFSRIGAATLKMVAANLEIDIAMNDAHDLIEESFTNLPPHPEVLESLSLLKDAGYKLVALTNSSEDSLEAKLENAGINSFFSRMLSIEQPGKFKPFREVYDWAVEQMDIESHEALLIAAHGWDVAGALWAGWRAAFIARPGQQKYPLSPDTEITAPNLLEVTKKLISYS